MLNIAAYLRRIAYHGPLAPTVETLRALHLAHMRAVPFENLDVYGQTDIALDADRLFDKIVRRRRGGFCYELNGLFGELLRALGFDVTMLAAQVANDHGGFGPEFDHLLLLVTLEERWLADVGFGDSFQEPLRLDDPGEQAQVSGVYRLLREGERWTLRARGAEGSWSDQYTFTFQPRRLADFADECRVKQTSPYWTDRRICTRATPDGRMTLSDMRLIVTTHGERQERELASGEEYTAALRKRFGIET